MLPTIFTSLTSMVALVATVAASPFKPRAAPTLSPIPGSFTPSSSSFLPFVSTGAVQASPNTGLRSFEERQEEPMTPEGTLYLCMGTTPCDFCYAYDVSEMADDVCYTFTADLDQESIFSYVFLDANFSSIPFLSNLGGIWIGNECSVADDIQIPAPEICYSINPPATQFFYDWLY
ncbi:hypothetical protein JAAARDRAFT_54181 [Jaapia argillacea MUCL 33604]|uniref:Uncharacterized protein n=1 Tax=Jaapia argillacea MUCL 33604 TaxID=933084 RepID=A0A067Q7I3_9AGAM|nr:hypothetical protein JAAARDRAFT_54181 [Jaapia argillacea MUCL 33604]